MTHRADMIHVRFRFPAAHLTLRVHGADERIPPPGSIRQSAVDSGRFRPRPAGEEPGNGVDDGLAAGELACAGIRSSEHDELRSNPALQTARAAASASALCHFEQEMVSVFDKRFFRHQVTEFILEHAVENSRGGAVSIGCNQSGNDGIGINERRFAHFGLNRSQAFCSWRSSRTSRTARSRASSGFKPAAARALLTMSITLW